jgi:hypothetical protein
MPATRGRGAAAEPRRGAWVASFIVLGIAIALSQTATATGFDATGMIYIDMGRHIARGDGIVSTIYFPSHIPKFPSPIALWPPLYPAAIAILLALGIDAAIASRLISIAAFGVTVGLVWLIGTDVFGEGVGTIAALLLMAWPSVTGIAAMALSENLFIMFLTLSVWFTVRLLRNEAAPRASGLAAAGGLAMSAAALTRYPGLAVMAIAAGLLLLDFRAVPWRSRLKPVAIWSICAGALPVLLLLRNRLVTGAFMGRGRPPDDQGVIYHMTYAAKTLVTDGLKLLWRLLVIPEAFGLDSRVMVFVVLAAVGLLFFGLVRSRRMRRDLLEGFGVLTASPGCRFVVAVGTGYWVVMVVVRSMTAFEPLNTRMLMPAYPLVLICLVAASVAFLERLGLGRRTLVGVVSALFAISAAAVILPRTVAAGGPRLAADAAPAWVQWVGANTPAGAPIVGNRSTDFSFYLDRPSYSFQVFAVYRSGDRFDRDCALISNHLTTLGWKGAYLVLHVEEERELDIDLMARRYGPMIGGLLRGEPTLPVRQVARQPEFAAYVIQDSQWTCKAR